MNWLRVRGCGAALLVAFGVSGCAGFDSQLAGGPCLDDTPNCVAERRELVHQMSTDPGRHWIGEPAGRMTVASGVRLFAYQNVRDKLSCAELANAITELDAERQVLAEGPAPGQSVQRHDQIKAMTEDVRASLVASKLRKCGAA